MKRASKAKKSPRKRKQADLDVSAQKRQKPPPHLFEELASKEHGVCLFVVEMFFAEFWPVLRLVGKGFWDFLLRVVYEGKKPVVSANFNRLPRRSLFAMGGVWDRLQRWCVVRSLSMVSIVLPPHWPQHFLARSYKCLRVLVLENIEIDAEAFGTVILAMRIDCGDVLSRLQVINCGLTDQHFSTFLVKEHFPRLKVLENLVLSRNSISDGGVTALTKVFTRLPSLKRVDLRRNRITDAGAASLRRNLTHKSRLRINV